MLLLQPISEINLKENTLTAIILWNFSTGIKKDDVPFKWEKTLRRKYGDSINIIKVNMDINAAWREPHQYNMLVFMQEVLDKVNSTFGR